MRPGRVWSPEQDFTALVECRLADGSTTTASFADADQAARFVELVPAFQASAEPEAEILDIVALRLVAGLWGAN